MVAGRGFLGFNAIAVFLWSYAVFTVHTVNLLIYLFAMESFHMSGIKCGPRSCLFSLLGYDTAIRILTLMSVG
jgi:hypothetical protein